MESVAVASSPRLRRKTRGYIQSCHIAICQSLWNYRNALFPKKVVNRGFRFASPTIHSCHRLRGSKIIRHSFHGFRCRYHGFASPMAKVLRRLRGFFLSLSRLSTVVTDPHGEQSVVKKSPYNIREKRTVCQLRRGKKGRRVGEPWLLRKKSSWRLVFFVLRVIVTIPHQG